MKEYIKSLFIGENDEELSFHLSGIVSYIPLIVCGGFFLLTILIFAFGPLEWKIKNPLKLYAFLILCCLSLSFGYIVSMKRAKTIDAKINLNTNRILLICSAVFIVSYVPTLLVTTGKWYPDIITGIFNTGKAYRLAKYFTEQGPLIVLYIRMLLYPFIIMIMPITLYFMPKLSKSGKIAGIVVIILSLCMSISQGVNKLVADTTAQIVLFLLMMFFSNSIKRSKIKYRLKVILVIILVLTLFFAYYSASMRNRVALDEMNYSDEELITGNNADTIPETKLDESIKQNATFGYSKVKENYILFKIIPIKLQPTALYLASYISHGYMGLSIAMDQEFTSTYGLGFSDFFRHNILKIVGKSSSEERIVAQTYQAKTNREAWKTGDFWSTFFVYPASDISFPGTVLLVFLVGYLFALSWKDALKTENPFAIVSFYGFCTMIFYFSANNQMFQTGENFIGFITMIIFWLLTRNILLKKARGENRE